MHTQQACKSQMLALAALCDPAVKLFLRNRLVVRTEANTEPHSSQGLIRRQKAAEIYILVSICMYSSAHTITLSDYKSQHNLTNNNPPHHT